MIGPAVALRRIPMSRQDDVRPEFPSPHHGGIKIVQFKPQQYAVSVSEFRIADGAVMMIHTPVVQLHQQLAIRNQLLVLASAVPALAAQKTLVPATACFDISYTNEGLGTHSQRDCNATTAASLLTHPNFMTGAQDAYRLAGQILPGNPEAVNGLANLLEQTGRPTETPCLLEHSARQYPDNLKALENICPMFPWTAPPAKPAP